MTSILYSLALLVVLAWGYLLIFRGRFWRADQRLEPVMAPRRQWPSVAAIVPARDEERVIARSLASLRRQEYSGPFRVVLVDDGSRDRTVEFAAAVASGEGHSVTIIRAGPVPSGWSGKLWAMQQGIQHLHQTGGQTKYLWCTDADIEHDPRTLRLLVQRAEHSMLDLVSTMVALHCKGFWERLLIPAFVFYFQKLYPFRYVNKPDRATAAAAGGSMLINRSSLLQAGGLTSIRAALIDDCALAKLLKHKGQIWLGLTACSRSIRAYGLADIWSMVTRSAYAELRYTPWRLLLVVGIMSLLYLFPVVATAYGAVNGDWLLVLVGAAAWSMMTTAYLPTLRFYGQSTLLALLLPLTSLLYVFMTLDSARRHWQGRGGYWKGRTQSQPQG